MTITIPSLGPSWLPKLGGLLAIFSAAYALVPDATPGARYVKPYLPFMNALSASLIGMTARQNNVTSEKAGAVPMPPDPSVKPADAETKT